MKPYELWNPNTDRDTATLLKRWLENRNAGLSFADYLLECDYNQVTIWDAGEIGRLLYHELYGTQVQINMFIDRNAEGIHAINGIPVYPLSQVKQISVESVSLVSTIFNFPEIQRLLLDTNPKLRSIYLKDAVYEMEYKEVNYDY